MTAKTSASSASASNAAGANASASNTPDAGTPPLSATLTAHADSLARQLADATVGDAAQRRLLQSLPDVMRRPAWPRFVLATASLCALAVFGLALFLGDQSPAFATVQRHLRDFTTLRVEIEQGAGDEVLPATTLLLDASGSLRTDVGSEVSVIVDTRAGAVLTLLHGARTALRTPLPAAPTPDDALQWLDAIRTFQGEATPLDERRSLDGEDLRGWRLHAHGLQIDLWADADGLPRSMQIGGAHGVTLDYRFTVDAPIDAALLSAKLPPGYTLGAPDAD